MHVGHYISGAGHAGLIGWLLLGNIFQSEPLPFEVASVSVVTGAEFEALLAAQTAPQSTTDVVQPAPPDAPVETPEVTPAPDAPVENVQPAPVETPVEETPPEVVEEALPPEAEVSDQAPQAPTPPADIVVPVPEVAPVAVPREADRVAPEAVALPDPEARPDPEEAPAVAPDQSGETQEPREATAPEEATTQIVTEADEQPRAAPNQSARPPARRPTRPAAQTAQAEETPDDQAAAIAAAVAQSIGSDAPAEAPAAAPSGPPLSGSEKEGLKVAVSECWNVDVGGRSADTVVTVGVSLDREGKVSGPVRMIESQGGDRASVTAAFNAARRAILRCQKGGYDLPAEKYDQWREVEFRFNPEGVGVN